MRQIARCKRPERDARTVRVRNRGLTRIVSGFDGPRGRHARSARNAEFRVLRRDGAARERLITRALSCIRERRKKGKGERDCVTIRRRELFVRR